MKKKLLPLLGAAFLALTLAVTGCNVGSKTNSDDAGSNSSEVTPSKQTFTVAFEVDGTRYKTMKVKEGEKITETVGNPTKEGYNFVGWYEGSTLIDLAEYVVTHNVTFTAKFEEKHDEGPVLSVDDVKEEGKEYYLVLGWWETTKTNDDGTPKQTSHMTKETTRLFYGNLIKYLKATGATDENIAAISFRNYATAEVAEMGDKVKADGDVDLLVGVGNNVNSTAGLTLYGETNDSKFQTPMGEGPTSRYVALLDSASELGVSTYQWLKETDAGKKAFVSELTDQEITDSLAPETINLTVTVHGDTDAVTLLDDKDDVITMPTITVPDGKIFKGFALTNDGEVALEVAKDATLKYDDVKQLVANGENTLDLYPVIKDAPVVEEDLIIYVQVNGSYLTQDEAELLETRYKATKPDKNIKFNIINAKAAAFKEAVGDDADVLVGGKSPLQDYPTHESGPLANAGTGHFADDSRKVVILSTVNPNHLTLAQDFYAFIVADYVAE